MKIGGSGGGSTEVADQVSITGEGTALDPFVAVGAAPSGNAVLSSLRLNPAITPGIFTISTSIHDWNPASLSTTTLIRAQSADDEGSRITGITALTDGAIRVIMNHSTVVDDGIIVLQHENAGSVAANRFLTPNEDDYFIPKNGSAIIVYDATRARWMVLGSGGRLQQSTVQQLGFFPEATTDVLTGSYDDWEPTAASMQNNAYASGLGAAGTSRLWKDSTLWRMNVAVAGATLTGLTVYSNADSGGHSPIKILMNINSPGTLTLKHLSTSSLAANRISCPSGVDLVVPPYGVVMLASTSAAGWNVVSVSWRTDGVIAKSSVDRLSLGAAAPGVITPANLPNSQTDNYAPTGFVEAGVIRVTGGGSSCALSGFDSTGIAVGDLKTFHTFGSAIILKYLSASSIAANRIYTPGGVDKTIPYFGSFTLRYDSLGAWFLVSVAE